MLVYILKVVGVTCDFKIIRAMNTDQYLKYAYGMATTRTKEGNQGKS